MSRAFFLSCVIAFGAACTAAPAPETSSPSASAGGSGGGSSPSGGAGGGGGGSSSSSAGGGAGGQAPSSSGTPDAGATPDPTPSGGTTGSTGGSGGSDQPDAGAPDAGPSTTPPGDDTASYACTLIFGINATDEWYSQGFEKLVDGNKWEIIKVHSGFIELWADPNNGFWKTGIGSPCTQGAMAPDRIIFTALNFDFTTLDQWLPPLTATVKNLQMKYPSAKRIELATFVRAPHNMACPQREPKRSTIAAAEDQAIEMVAAANPDLVRISPKFEAMTCGEFSGNPPHPTAAGGAAWAKQIAAHYGMGK